MSEATGKVHEGFERAFQLVGGHGKYQWTVTAIISFQLVIMTWNHLGYVFLGAVPNHWCSIPELENTNWTLEQKWKISLPSISGAMEVGSNGNGKEKWDKCHYYDFNYTDILGKASGDFSRALAIVEGIRDKNDTRVTECSKWDYDHSIYISTVATEFNLVCGRKYLAATIQSTYMTGGLIGTISFGPISDKILGRRRSVLLALCLVIFGGISAAFANTYSLFVALRFIIAIGVAGCMQNCNVLVVENSGISHRAVFAILGGVSFGIGYTLMPLYAYFLRDWSSLQLGFSLTSTILLAYIWILPDSPRWLATNGREEAAQAQLLKIAKTNGMPVPGKEQLLVIIRDCQENRGGERGERTLGCLQGLGGIARNFRLLLADVEMRRRTLVLWVLFFAVAFVYYGFTFSTNLSSNPYILVFFGGLVEILSCLMVIPFLSNWGRRPTTAFFYFLTALCAMAIALTPQDIEWVRVLLSMSGKLFVAGAFNVVYLLSSELYPTEVRTTGQSVAIVLARFGSISSPYAVSLLVETYADLPCLIFGGLAVVAGFIALLLPETKDKDIADHVNQLQQ